MMEKELPKGWGSQRLKQIVSYQKGKKPKVLSESEFENSVPYLDIKAFEKGEIRQYADILSSNIIDEHSIGVVWDGARSGWVTKGQKGAIGSTIAKLSPIGVEINYLYHFLKYNYQFINTNARGVGIPHVDPIIFWNLNVPLPPLPEQERIVAKLDTIFAHLEVAKQGLEKIPVLLKQFRQAVLTQAVTGKLTEEWREGKELELPKLKMNKKVFKMLLDDKSKDFYLFDLPKYWAWKKISDISDVKGGKRLPKGESLVRYNTGFPYIKAGDLKKGTVLQDKLEFLLPETQKKIKNYTISNGDVYITNVGACIGDSGIVPDELNGANLTENALKMCNFEGVLNKYLAFWLRSPIAQKFINQSILSAAQGKLALGRVEVFPIPLCSIAEQTEIVRRVEALFSKADAIEARYKKLKAQIDQLPQAVLAKAFRGEV